MKIYIKRLSLFPYGLTGFQWKNVGVCVGRFTSKEDGHIRIAGTKY